MIPFPKKSFVGGSLKLGFFSVRHNAISEQGVDFEEHCVRRLWVAWSHGPWKNNMWELTKLSYATRFGFYAPRPNCQHVPEWLEEVSCNSP
jgi:hypothetical protein